MISAILHKNKYSSVELQYVIGENSKSYCTFNTNLQTKSESLFKSKMGNCVANSIAFSAEKIFEYYVKYGNQIFDKLKLEFTFALYNRKEDVFFASRDKIGVKPFYYYDSDEIFIFSTDIAFIIKQINCTELNTDWIISSLTATVYDKTTSQILGIKKLPPAHYITIKKGKLRIEKYWELAKIDIDHKNQEDYLSELKRRFVLAVKNRVSDSTGAELSGGLDSSAIVGVASKGQESFYTYSHTLQNDLLDKIFPYSDERYFRNLVVNRKKNIRYRNIDAENKGLFHEMSAELKHLSVPVTSTLAYFSDGIFDKAKEDHIETLLSGFGGDEGISNFANILPYQYAKSLQFLELQSAIGKPFYSKTFIARILKTHLKFLSRSKNNWRQDSFNMLFLNKDFMESYKVEQKYWEYHKHKSVHNLDEYLFMKLNENYISNRTEATGAAARVRGIEYSFPLLDVDLLEYYYSMPNRLKYNNGVGRYAYRQIIKDFVPKEIYLRTDKTGATVPNVLARFMKDYQLIEEFLQSVRNGKAAQYIDFEKMILNMKLIKRYSEGERIRANQHIFFNALMLVLYLEGEY